MHHGAGLRRLLTAEGRDQAAIDLLLNELARDAPADGVAPADQALLAYALQVTHAPATITLDDISALRAHHFGDRAIHDLCAITAYYAFVNRIADGLGVELEEP